MKEKERKSTWCDPRIYASVYYVNQLRLLTLQPTQCHRPISGINRFGVGELQSLALTQRQVQCAMTRGVSSAVCHD